MKKKGIILSIIGLVLISCLLVVIVSKNSKKYIMQDGAMLALTLDGELISKFPEGTNYHVDIECTNATATWLVEEWKLSLENIIGNVACNIDFTTRDSDDKLVSVVESAIPDNNYDGNGYRYSGKTPNNYIWFNNEMWRIIGSIPTCISSGCSTSTNLVKIIRNQSIGGLTFNNTESNTTWGNNTLFTLLNTYYYGKKNATSSNVCYGHTYVSTAYALCDYTSIGISSSSTDYYGKMIESVYWNVGIIDSTSSTISVSYSLESATKTSENTKIGLMNASDFGYASGQTSISLSSLSNYEQDNWLYSQGVEWTMTPSSTEAVLYIWDMGRPGSDRPTSGYAVRPVVYLDPNVYVVSGDGSITYPYQIAM